MGTDIKIAVAGMYHETNTFVSSLTELHSFESEWVQGREAFINRYSDTKTSMGGVIDEAKRCGVKLLPGLYVGATPSGIVTSEAADAILDRIVESVDPSIHGLLLILHGAMVSEDYADMEGELLKRIRRRFSAPFPIAATLDLHANISSKMVNLATIIVGYDTYPHIDTYERATEATTLLVRTIRGEIKPFLCFFKAKMMVVPQAMRTADGAMKELMDCAFAMEKESEILNVTVAGGFPYSDVSDAGMSFVVTTNGEPILAKKCVNKLGRRAWKLRNQFKVDAYPVEEALKLALAIETGPIVLIEGSDNVGGGSPGDATFILKQIVKLPRKSLVVVRDSEAAKLAHKVGVDGILECDVGGKSDSFHGEPVPIRGKIRLLSDGKYQHVGPYMTGQWADMGKTAVVEVGQTTLILTECRTPPWDLGHVSSVGIRPEEYQWIVVKSAIAWQTAFGDIAQVSIQVDSPGCCSLNLRDFTYRNVKRPIFPLDMN